MSRLKTLKGALEALQEAMWGNKESRALVPINPQADEGTAILSPDGKETFDLGRRAFLGRSADVAASPMLRGMFPRGALSTLARQVAQEEPTDLLLDRLAKVYTGKYQGVYEDSVRRSNAGIHADMDALDRAANDMLSEAGMPQSKADELFGERGGFGLLNSLYLPRHQADYWTKQASMAKLGKLAIASDSDDKFRPMNKVDARQTGAHLLIPNDEVLDFVSPGLTPLQRLKFFEALSPGVHTQKARATNATVDLLLDHSAKKREWAQLLNKAAEERRGASDWGAGLHTSGFDASHYARKRLLDALK